MHFSSGVSKSSLGQFLDSQVHSLMQFHPFDEKNLGYIINSFLVHALKSLKYSKTSQQQISSKDIFLNYTSFMFPTLELGKKFLAAFISSLRNCQKTSSRAKLLKMILIGSHEEKLAASGDQQDQNLSRAPINYAATSQDKNPRILQQELSPYEIRQRVFNYVLEF